MIDVACKGNAESFLDAMLNFESGIDPLKVGWYLENLDNRVIPYVCTNKVGRLVRSWETGAPIQAMLTVREYFDALGVPITTNLQIEDFRKLRYQSTNALGFIGYQIGEAILISCGYYEAELRTYVSENVSSVYPSYYCGAVDSKSWRCGCEEVLFQYSAQDRPILATDVNLWRGKFVGKDGIHSLDDLKDPIKQNFVMRSIFTHNWGSCKMR